MDDGKYGSRGAYALARLQRSLLRALLAPIVRWGGPEALAPGCTAVIGMCSRLPDVMAANATCLRAARWPELAGVVIAVDGRRGCLPAGLEERVRACLGDLPCEFHYYGPLQSRIAEALRLPYVYSWLSWSIALAHVRTETVLIHDYDALLLGSAMRQRYDTFRASRALVQGVRWYKSNGIRDEDRLATTFEAFVDTRWLRRFAPIRMFNQIGRLGGRSVDFDTLLELQARDAPREARTVCPMAEDELTHPSQMIHQYTMFRRHPAADLPCYSMPMIPFFSWLGGRSEALANAAACLRTEARTDVRLFADDVRVNLGQLRAEHVDWQLKQMLQACLSLRVAPTPALREYGDALYAAIDVGEPERWKHHFLPEQRAWVEAARATAAPAQPAA